MKFTPSKIPDVIIVEPDVFGDHRGFFMETWHEHKFTEGGITANFVQDNHSRSKQATLRGLHYQINQPQGKLVRVLAGEVYDVAASLIRTRDSRMRHVILMCREFPDPANSEYPQEDIEFLLRLSLFSSVRA